MGLDTQIVFRSKTASLEFENLPSGFRVVPARDFIMEECQGATHEIDTLSRYYAEGYERGPWPRIAAVLMELLASEHVEKVWYGHDACEPPELTPDRVCEISRHYMTHGNRPYFATEPT